MAINEQYYYYFYYYNYYYLKGFQSQICIFQYFLSQSRFGKKLKEMEEKLFIFFPNGIFSPHKLVCPPLACRA